MWLVGGAFVPEGPSKKLAPMYECMSARVVIGSNTKRASLFYLDNEEEFFVSCLGSAFVVVTGRKRTLAYGEL